MARWYIQMGTSYCLRFDRRITYGSPEHFFHFMWGYLLPAVHMMIAGTLPVKSRFVFSSSGPVMDELTSDLMNLFDQAYSIVQKSAAGEPQSCTEITVPRWDIGLLRDHLLNRETVASKHLLQMQAELDQNTMLLDSLKSTNFLPDLSAAIARVRSEVLNRVPAVEDHNHLDIYAECHLILARSNEPAYYAEGGEAEIPKYGTSRRALTGIHEAAQELRRRGIRAQVFEPGRYSLTEQIQVFRHCRGIVGIKGAEFANLIWMRPGSRAILIKPSVMDTPSVQMCLADVLGLHYAEIPEGGGSYPALKAIVIEKYLTQP